MSDFKIGIYRHFKGNKYRVLYVAKHSENLEEFVVYEALYDNKISKIWVRPLSMFTDKVEENGQLVDRYAYIGEE